MDNFIKKMFSQKPQVPNSSKNDIDSNKTINEAIIIDMLKNPEAINKFYNNLGGYGARDGLLSESVEIPNTCDHAYIAAILACAKDADSKDYALYIKAGIAKKAFFARMENSFGNLAKERIAAQKGALDSNCRIQDALEKSTTDTSK